MKNKSIYHSALASLYPQIFIGLKNNFWILYCIRTKR